MDLSRGKQAAYVTTCARTTGLVGDDVVLCCARYDSGLDLPFEKKEVSKNVLSLCLADAHPFGGSDGISTKRIS